MGTHPVLDKQLVDISLAHGVEEGDREELVDWTKDLCQVDNLVYDNSKALTLRPGLKFFTGSVAARRLAALDDGVGYVGTGGSSFGSAFFQVAEQAATVTNKGAFPEFTVTSKVAGYDPGGSSTQASGLAGVANFTKYTCVAYYTPSPVPGNQLTVVVQDRLSGNIVKKWTYIRGGADVSLKVLMVGVSDRYLHFYVQPGVASGLKPGFFQVDTDNLPATIGGSLTLLTGVANNDQLVGAVAITGASVVAVQGTTVRLEKFSTGGVSTATGSDTGVSNTSGIDTDGTNFYTVGWLTGAPDRYKLKRWNSSLVVTSTVTDTTATTASSRALRVASNTTGDCAIVAYDTSTVNGNAIPAITLFSCAVAATTFSLGGTLGMWVEGSLPFYNADLNKYYVQLHNLTSNDANEWDLVAHSSVLVEIPNSSAVGSGGFQAPNVYRPACVLDNYTAPIKAAQNTRSSGVYNHLTYKPHADTTGKILCAIGNIQAVSESAAVTYSALQLEVNGTQVSFAGNNASGGFGSVYDGQLISETGFLAAPSLFLATSGTGLTGVYNYLAVLSYIDASGNVHYSRCSKISSLTLVNQGVDCKVTVPGVSNRAGNEFCASLYRTTAGGTQYYLLERIPLKSGAAPDIAVAFTVDNVADATLTANPLLYRQPGTPGTALDRYPMVASEHVCAHKDRVFHCRDKTVYYSSFKVDNEAHWYNPALSFLVPAGSGRITGLASQDGVLVVFKRDAVHVVDGDGPAENGGNGSEFSTPRRINTEFGCIDARSIVSTPLGTMYRSTRGIELLDRNFTVQYIGASIWQTVSSFPNTGGACFDKVNGTVLWALGNTLQTAAAYRGMFDVGYANGVVICYDTQVNAWSTFTYPAMGSDVPIQDLVYAKAKGASSDDVENVWSVAYGGLYYNSSTSKIDSTTGFIPWTIKTGWVKPPVVQDRIKVTDLYLAGAWVGNHQVKVSYRKDYNKAGNFTTIKQWPVATVSASQTVVQLNAQPPVEEVQSMQFKIESVETDNAGGFPNSNAGQLDIFGLTVRLGLKGGGVKLPVAQKG